MRKIWALLQERHAQTDKTKGKKLLGDVENKPADGLNLDTLYLPEMFLVSLKLDVKFNSRMGLLLFLKQAIHHKVSIECVLKRLKP